MLKRLFTALVILLAAVSFSFAASGSNMKEGLWEITSTVKMQGMNMPSHTHTQCITKNDLVPKSSQPGQECTISDYKIEGNTVTWSIQCSTQGGDMKGTGNEDENERIRPGNDHPHERPSNWRLQLAGLLTDSLVRPISTQTSRRKYFRTFLWL
jgi:hypothetical protein